MLGGMVESNHDEERMARIEHMIEGLQRKSAALEVLSAKLVVAVAKLTPALRHSPATLTSARKRSA
jgi:hypothetical protein